MATSVLDTAPFDLAGKPTKTDLLGKYFRTLADPTRLKILKLVRDEERPVGEIVQKLGMSQPRVSGHLGCLRWCGFVKTRRQGTTIFYSISDERVVQILDLASGLLDENEDHVAACRQIDEEVVGE